MFLARGQASAVLEDRPHDAGEHSTVLTLACPTLLGDPRLTVLAPQIWTPVRDPAGEKLCTTQTLGGRLRTRHQAGQPEPQSEENENQNEP